ncbi:hypothetical protein HanRHA438_Chr00c21g0852481 [Helianthus annuus]|nr:hypothetical protein HanRHA438_Chr00c21g0852481 [Helianthus annuus]
MVGVLTTIPSLFTHTRTLSQMYIWMMIVPLAIICALTFVFSFSIMFTAQSPSSPTNSGHEVLPAKYNYKSDLVS